MTLQARAVREDLTTLRRRVDAVEADARAHQGLRARLALLERVVTQQAQRLASLEAIQPRDAEDEHLRVLLATATEGLPFRASELVRRGEVNEHLGAALRACCLQGAGEVGAWLRDHVGTHSNITITKHDSKRWLVTASTSST